MKKILALALALIMCLSIFAACGNTAAEPAATEEAAAKPAETQQEEKPAEKPAEKIELSIIHYCPKALADTDPKTDAFNIQLEKFIAENPDIVIEDMGMAHDDMQPKIQAMAAVGDLPDIFMVKGPWIDEFNKNGYLSDLSADIDAYEYKDAYRDGIFFVAQRGDAIYGLPMTGIDKTGLVWYNKDLWKQAGYDTFPETWDEVMEAGEKFKEMGITPIGLGNKDKWPINSCWLSTIGSKFTGPEWTESIIARDGNAKFTDPEFVACMQFLRDLVADGYINKDFNSIDGNMVQGMLTEGKCAMILDGGWACGTMLAAENANIGVAAIPQPANAKGDANISSGCCGWFLALNSKLEGAEREAAIKLMFTLLGKEHSDIIASKYKNVITACKVEVDDSDTPALQQEFNKLNNEVGTVPVYDILMNVSVIDVMNTCLQAVMEGAMTAEDAAEQIQAAQDAW